MAPWHPAAPPQSRVALPEPPVSRTRRPVYEMPSGTISFVQLAWARHDGALSPALQLAGSGDLRSLIATCRGTLSGHTLLEDDNYLLYLPLHINIDSYF